MPSNPGQNSLHKPHVKMSPKPHTKCNPNPRTCPLNPTLKCHQTPQKSNNTSQRKIHTSHHTTSFTTVEKTHHKYHVRPPSFSPTSTKVLQVFALTPGRTDVQSKFKKSRNRWTERISLVCRTNQKKKRFHMFKITPMGMEHSKRVRF